MDNKTDYDVIIVGAGISGLVCGCYLAKAGLKTLIIEKNAKPGGYCASFKRSGFLFDACAHGLSSLRPNGRMYKILEELGISESIKIHRINPADKIVTKDFKINFYSELDRTINEFKIHFPSEEEAIKSFLNFIVNTPLKDLSKFRKKTFDQLLKDYFKGSEIIAVFSVLVLGLLGSSPNQISALVAVLCIREFLFDGGYYPKGGMQKFADVLRKKFVEYGGNIQTLTSVEKIIINNGVASGVITNKNDILKSKYVVSACDAIQTYTKLIERNNLNNDFLNKLLKMEPSLSSFLVYLTTNIPSSEFSSLETNTWIINNFNVDDSVSKMMINGFSDYMVITSPTLKSDTSLKEQNISICLAVNAVYRKDDYWIVNRDRVAMEMVTLAEKVIPNLSKRIISKIIATPLTLEKWTNNHLGAAYGWKSNTQQFCDPEISQKTKINNLYLTGHWSNQSSGITFVANCGYDTADMILRRGNK